ncbi:hypothetical protein V1514DRAFT_339620 [Lipomyces japonicus]|uniref:uncharacterized protein n=1 Tax=Lipomyces japonicus TaxID=56871 RepID=UPI0034CE8D87
MPAYESIIYIAREVLIYQIPPLRSAQGYRAVDWSVDKPLWRGRLRIIEFTTTTPKSADDGDHEDYSNKLHCELRLEDANTGELFATAPYLNTGKGVEPVVDSTRFFVIRVVDGQRHAYLGMGFQERSDSFDFNIALQDYKRRANPLVQQEFDTHQQAKGAQPVKDYSLKSGETIKISIGSSKNRPKTLTNDSSSTSTTAASGAFPFLPPPPTAQQVRDKLKHAHHEDDDFGEFVS